MHKNTRPTNIDVCTSCPYYIISLTFAFYLLQLYYSVLVVQPDPDVNTEEYSVAEWLFTTKPGVFGLIGGYANPTGVVLIVILIVMFVCSQPFVRRGGSFEVRLSITHLSEC